MRSDWEKHTLNDICKRIYSGGTPSTKHPEYWNGSLKWLSSGETNQRFIYDTEKRITQEGADKSSTKYVPAGCTVIASAGQGHTRGQASFLMTDTYINQSVIACEPNCEYILPLYLYYNLDNRYGEFRLLSDGTSTRGGLSGWILKRMEVFLPSLSEQQKVVDLLYDLDNKIENNNRINQNLEQQAQTLFKNRFINNSYQVDLQTTLGCVCSCELGGTPSRNNPDYWNGCIPWINSGEVNHFRITSPSAFITTEGLKHSATKLLPSKTTVLAITGATLGQVSLLEIECCTNQSVVGIIPNETLPYEFIYPFIQANIQKLISYQTGGAQQHINKKNIQELSISLPTSSALVEYSSFVAPLYATIAQNCFENEKLVQLRNGLLPKLMSGELDVSGIDL